MTLELKHLAPYLPYNLKLYMEEEFYNLEGLYLNGDVFDANAGEIPMELTKPILRPLTDLVKDEYSEALLNLCVERGSFKSDISIDFKNCRAKIIQKPFGKIYKLVHHEDWVCIVSLNEPDRTKRYIFDWLVSNHFDVFGLIDKGLAVDINKL